MVNYLLAVLSSNLENLPKDIFAQVYIEAFQHISVSLEEVVSNPGNRNVNTLFYENFRVYD